MLEIPVSDLLGIEPKHHTYEYLAQELARCNRELAAKEQERKQAMIVSVVILLSGYIAPKLPFNRHTGLRLPWTVQDEDTWNVAHKIIGIISLPLVVLYITAFCTIQDFEEVTLTVTLLWIGIPGLISLVFWWKKFYGKM